MQPAHMTEKTLCLQGGERRDTEQYAENGGTMEVIEEKVRRESETVGQRNAEERQATAPGQSWHSVTQDLGGS